jgi:3',5'-cyclic AMP phosphodiesterase CpdA
LLDFITTSGPDLVTVSGDLTQRARIREFLQARKFLDAIPFPKIVVPGNHDVPLYNVFARLFRKLDRFRHYISDDLEPFYINGEIAVLGINTARALTGKNGRINSKQLEKLCARFSTVPKHIKIIVTHHPFDLPPGVVGNRVVLRAEAAMKALAQIPVDMLLAGHFHVAGTTHTTTRYKINNFAALIVASGTAISTRERGQSNSLNVIDIAAPTVTIAQHHWRSDHGIFERFSTERFVRCETGWFPV